MFYILVFSGVTFFCFGVVATLANTLRISQEYDAMITQLVETEDTVRDLESKYSKSQEELKIFRMRLESSKAWASDEINEAHLELEKLKAEYVKVKVRASSAPDQNMRQVEEKCKKLLSEAEEYNRMLEDKNKELNEMKSSFEHLRTQLDSNQKTLADTRDQLKSLESFSDTHDKIKDLASQIDELKSNTRKSLPRPGEDKKSGDNESETGLGREHIDTMKSFLDSLDKRSDS
jgi:chromosome segregation ATPase